MITIDGNAWEVPCDIDRAAEVRASDISGLMLDRSYFNDVLGTYMSYDVSLAVPTHMASDYNVLYEALTEPVEGHVFVLPHGTDTITVTGRVTSVRDTLVYTVSGRQYWRGIRFNVIANHPSKREEWGSVVSNGRLPYPEVYGIGVGDLYQFTASGWVHVTYEDYETVRF